MTATLECWLRFLAVLNRDGGTLRTMNIDAFCAVAQTVFASHGHQFEYKAVHGKDVQAALLEAARTPGIDVLLAGGGDGTISTAADIAYREQVPLAVLPAGTMNMFARALKIPMDINDAMVALAGGEIVAVDIATANGKPFVHQFGVGIHAKLIRIRESMTYRSRIGKMFAGLRAVFSAVLRPPRFQAQIQTGRGTIATRRASGISISNNPYGDGHMPHADGLTSGTLGVYVAAPMTATALFRLCIEVFFGRWRSSPFVTENEVSEVTLRFPNRKRSAQAVIDGELIRLAPEVVLKSHPKALRVVVPKTADLQ